MGRVISFDIPYLPDPRGGKLERFDVSKRTDGAEGLLLCGPAAAVNQIVALSGDAAKPARLTESGAKKFTHALRFDEGVPQQILDLAELLTEILSIPAPEHVNHALALDWYTQPGDNDLEHTRAGDYIHWTKHALHPDWSNSRNARREMLRDLAALIDSHPILAGASAIVAAPGHKADGQSFGEVLAREVAAKIGKPFVESSAPGGPRKSQKEIKQDLTAAFAVDSKLTGTILVLDDVYQSGGSASGAAAAARRAGASSVISLAVARTIRK